MLSQYLKTLMPSTETRELKHSLQANYENVSGHIVPALETIGTVFNHEYRWKAPTLVQVEKLLRDSLSRGPLKMHNNPGLLEMLTDVFNNMSTTLPYIRGEVDKSFGREFTNIGLTFAKGNLIQFGEVADFTVYYARVLINYLTSNELMRLNGRTRDENLPVGDEEYLNANAPVFANAMKIMAYPVKDLKDQLRKIPDMVASEETEGSAKIMVGAGALDPLGFASLPFPISIIYHMRLGMAEKQAEELEAIKAEAKMVEYRILLIKQRQAGGQGDAAVERELVIQEDRLFMLRKKQKAREEQYGV